MVRRGGRIELRYHEECFVGSGDPRSQPGSSYTNSRLGALISDRAPPLRFRKMRTSSHF